MNHSEFYIALHKFISFKHEEFKNLFNDPTYEIIYKNEEVVNTIYKLRIRKLTNNNVLELFKREDMSWKSYYELILFLVINMSKDWLVNNLAKQGKIFEFELLSIINKSVQLAQKDIDDAARNQQTEFIKQIYESTGMLPDVNVMIEIGNTVKTPLNDYLNSLNHTADFNDYIRGFSKENPHPKVVEYYISTSEKFNNEDRDAAFIHAIQDENITLFKNLYKYHELNGEEFCNLINDLTLMSDITFINKAITHIFIKYEKYDIINNNKIIEYLMTTRELEIPPILEYCYSTKRLFILDNIMLDIIIDNNDIDTLKWFRDNKINIEFIQNTYRTIISNPCISKEVKDIIKSMFNS